MKISTCFILVLFFSATANAQSWIYAKFPGIAPRLITCDRLDNVIVFNNYSQTGAGWESKIAKFDKSGTMLWQRTLINRIRQGTGGGLQPVFSHTVDKDGNIYFISTPLVKFDTTSYTTDSSFALVKLDPNGKIKWIKKVPYSESIDYSIVSDGNYNLFIAGQSSQTYLRIADSLYAPYAYTTTKLFLSRIDTAGKVKWTKIFTAPKMVTTAYGPGSSSINRMYPVISVNSNSDVLLTGNFTSSLYFNGVTHSAHVHYPYFSRSLFHTMFDQNGNQLYYKQYPVVSDRDKVRNHILFNNGKAVLNYNSEDSTITFPSGNSGTLGSDTLFFLNANGTVHRKLILKVSDTDRFTSTIVRKLSESMFYVAGCHYDSLPNPTAGFRNRYQLRKYDTSGLKLASQELQFSPVGSSFPTSYPTDIAIGKDVVVTSGRFYISYGAQAQFGPFKVQVNAFLAAFHEKANHVTGRVYYDLNNNGIYDTADVKAKNKVFRTKGNDVFATDSNGIYSQYFPAGNHVDSVRAPNYYSISPAAYSYNFSATDSIIWDRDYRLQASAVANDLRVWLNPFGNASYSSRSHLHIGYENTGTTTQTATIKLKLSPLARFVTASTTPAMAGGDSVIWTIPAVAPRTTGLIVVSLDYNVAPLLTTIKSVVTVGPLAGDGTPADNKDSLYQFLRGSYDPNDKLCNPIDTLSRIKVQSGNEWIEYTINFQNTGTDTARLVRIIDNLSPLLDISTLEITGSTHDIKPSVAGNLLEIEFPSINLPDSFVNKAGSMGAVYFRIKPKATLAVGDTIKNTAAIYFDFNEPVITNTTRNYFKTTSTTAIVIVRDHNKEMTVMPNPVVRNELQFKLDGDRINGRYQLRIVDMNGRLVQWSSINVNSAVNKITTNNLHAGVYLVELTNGMAKYSAAFLKQ